MRRIAMIAIVVAFAMAFMGCAAYGPGVVPNGVIRSTDAAGGGDPAAYRVYTAYGQDKWGVNTATTIVVKETPSLPGVPSKSDVVYGQTAANSGVYKTMTEQVIPAIGTASQGAAAAWILKGSGSSNISVGDVNSGQIQGQGQLQGQQQQQQQRATSIAIQ